jgi:signal transduction histidine kinase
MAMTMESPRQETYQQLLSSYLDCGGGEGGLAVAYEFGRENLRKGMGLLEVVATHQQALDETLRLSDDCPLNKRDINKAASKFFNESLSPFEISLICSRDASAALLKLYDVFEGEAKRIAHRLHDESAQMLAVVYLELAEISENPTSDVSLKIAKVVTYLDEITNQLRTLSHELRPIILDQLGLLPAIRVLVEGVRKRSSLNIEINGNIKGRFDPCVETIFYRMVQEAITNICRHAEATQAFIHIFHKDGFLSCSVIDNGKGFVAVDEAGKSSCGLGLLGIHERVKSLGGSSEINSRSGFGTSLRIEVPI